MAGRTRIPVVRQFTGLVVGGIVVVLVGALVAVLSALGASDGDTRFAFGAGVVVAVAGVVMALVGLARLLDAVFDFLVEARDRLNAS